MCLFSLPLETRLQIYSQLLIQDSPVGFSVIYGTFLPHLVRIGRRDLFPAILLVNKATSREAKPLLYRNNRFRFPNAYTSPELDAGLPWHNSNQPFIAPFLQQIGRSAGFLTHICFSFPASFASWSPPVLHEGYLRVLELIRDTCTNLKVIEIAWNAPDGLLSVSDVDLAAEMLRTLDEGGLKAMQSLQGIVVVSEEYDIDEEDRAFCERLAQKLSNSKWRIELKGIPPRAWTSDYGRVEFDHEEDSSYNDEMYRREVEEEEREEMEEQEWWGLHDLCLEFP